MGSRETPPSEDDLYEARGVVPLARPIMQGDIFQNVGIPGIEDPQVLAAMIIQHPCSMRAGARLRPRLTVAAIRTRQSIKSEDWQGYGYAMLLPNLFGDGRDFMADFRDVGAVPSSLLDRSLRIAAITNYGIHILQQRQIYYLTRLDVDIKTLAETFDAIATELELQYEWVEAALGAGVEDVAPDGAVDVIESAERQFADFLDENDRALRNGLQQVASRADVRRRIRREIVKRFDDGGSGA